MHAHGTVHGPLHRTVPEAADREIARETPVRVLVVDNQDSFVHTIVQYLRHLGAACVVRDRSETTLADVEAADGVLLGPGPGRPEDAGVCLDIARTARRPVLGVCLGHQVIATAFGGTVGRAPELVHGYAGPVRHDGAGVFRGLPDPLTVTRYHSLALDPATVPPVLQVTARAADGVIMGVRHRTLPVEGVQFHPESVLSEGGRRLFANWLDDARTGGRAGRPPAKSRTRGV